MQNLKIDFLSKAFIEKLMQRNSPGRAIVVHEVTPLAIDNSASILSVLTAGRTATAIGHFGLQVSFEEEGEEKSLPMVMKIKPHGREVAEMLSSLAGVCGEALEAVYSGLKYKTGFVNTHMREPEVYGKLPDQGLQPVIYGLYADEEQDHYVILMEYLLDVELMNSVMQPESWTEAHIQQALLQMAAWHAQHLRKKSLLNPKHWEDAPSRNYMMEMSPLWQALLANAAEKFPALYTPGRVEIMLKAIEEIPDYWKELEEMPHTFVHNDFNPRNACFKNIDSGLRLCLYDWELATWHVPQYDLAEFLCFVTERNRSGQREAYIEFYRKELNRLSGQFTDKNAFVRGVNLAARDFGLHRLGMYMMAHSVSPYPFLPRVVDSYFELLEETGGV